MTEPSVTLEEFGQLPTKLQLRLVAWLRVNGQLDHAGELLDRIEGWSGSSATLLDERAALALAKGDLAAVRESWNDRLSHSSAPSTRAGYARALLELGEVDEAAKIATALSAEHGDLMTIQALAAEVALQQGDVATAHEIWEEQIIADSARATPSLALVRVAVLAGDWGDARRRLTAALANPEDLYSGQLSMAAGLAEMLGQSARAQTLRQRYVRLEADRTAKLAAEIATALGRDPGSPAAGFANVHLPAAGATSAGETTIGEVMTSTEVVETPATEEPVHDGRVLETLRNVFGHEGLLAGQAPVINRVVAGRDTLAILPTGAGKSLTFQLSAMLLPGTTL